MPPSLENCTKCNLLIQKLKERGKTEAQLSPEDFLLANKADLPQGRCPIHSLDDTTNLCFVNQILSTE